MTNDQLDMWRDRAQRASAERCPPLIRAAQALPEAALLLRDDPLPHDNDAIARALARLIDHTALKPETTESQIERLCQEALRYQFASVCLNPWWVSLAADRLAGSEVKVCTVVGFPLGATTTATKVAETREACQRGASEIDMVLNIGALRGDQLGQVYDDIRAVADAAHDGGAWLKVIIEAVLLTDEQKVLASALAQNAGADFVKTSTGFASGGATVPDVALMRQTVGEAIGVKAAGGVRSVDDALAFVRAGATRLGASAGVSIVQQAEEGRWHDSVSSSGY